jgi:hypothetical protein
MQHLIVVSVTLVTRHIDFIFCYGVVCFFEVFDEMMSCDVEFVAFFQNLSQSEQLVCC